MSIEPTVLLVLAFGLLLQSLRDTGEDSDRGKGGGHEAADDSAHGYASASGCKGATKSYGASGPRIRRLIRPDQSSVSRWTVFSAGGLRSHINMLHFGCDGLMDRHLNLAPWVTKRYWEAIQRQDFDDAMAVIEEIEIPLEEHLATYPGGRDASIHGLMELAGIGGRWRRKPYYSLSDSEMTRLGEFARQMKLL